MYFCWPKKKIMIGVDFFVIKFFCGWVILLNWAKDSLHSAKKKTSRVILILRNLETSYEAIKSCQKEFSTIYIYGSWLACREQEVTSSGQSVDAGSEVMDTSNNWEFKDGKVSKYEYII